MDTLHFVTADSSLHEIMLGLFFIKPGPGASACCTSKFFDSLCLFLLVTVTDNGFNAVNAANNLALILEEKIGRQILCKEKRCCCVIHTSQIAIKAVRKVMQKETAVICNVNRKLRLSK